MNVELFLYLKKNLLGMFKVSHLVEEATGRLLDMNSRPTFSFRSIFFSVLCCPKILRIFF